MADPTDPDHRYAAAVDELFGASFVRFVEERKRLVSELKTAGMKLPAQRLAAINRPPVSAWAINQLWRHARTEMNALFAAAARVRDGDLGAMGIHREVLADLKARAAELLKGDGNAASETVLRRIMQTLQALAAAGGFEPEAPGQLTADRDPPGFEALAGAVLARPAAAPAVVAVKPAGKTKSRSEAAAEARAEAAERDAETVVEEGEGDEDEDEDDVELTVAEDVDEVADLDDVADDEDAAAMRAELAAEARAAKRAELVAALAGAERTQTTAARDLSAAQTLLAAAQDRLARAEATATAARARVEALRRELADLD